MRKKLVCEFMMQMLILATKILKRNEQRPLLDAFEYLGAYVLVFCGKASVCMRHEQSGIIKVGKVRIAFRPFLAACACIGSWC